MSFVLEPTNDHESVIVRIGKALDFRNAAEFEAVCQEKVREGARNFILEFSETGILDSTGLGSIFSLSRQVSPLNGQVVFASVSWPVQVVIQLTRTNSFFRQFPSVEAAQEALTERAPFLTSINHLADLYQQDALMKLGVDSYVHDSDESDTSNKTGVYDRQGNRHLKTTR